MEADIKGLITAAASRDMATSTTAFVSLMRLMISNPQSHLHRILAAFCIHVNLKKIPTSILPGPSNQIDLERAVNSIKGITLAATLHQKNPEVNKTLREVWPNIFAWLRYLQDYYLDSERVSSESRVKVFIAISGAHKVFSQRDDLRALSGSTSGYLELLTRLWVMQVRFPEYISPLSVYPPASVLVAHTRTTIPTSAAAIEKIISALGGKPDDVARLALEHLSASAQQTSSQSNYSSSTGSVIDLMANFRTSPPLRYALLARHSVRAVTNILVSMSAAPFSQDTAPSVALCMANCGHYLGFALEQTNGLTWVIQTLNAQFLPAILRSGPWIPHMDPALVKHFLLPLTSILPKYLMYVSVLRAVSRALRKVRSLGLEAKLVQRGAIWDAWSTFKYLAEERLEILSQSKDLQTRQVCHNDKCHKTDTKDAFTLCGGCNEVYFCSQDCIDKTQSSHQRTCEEVQAWRKEGKSTPMSTKDFDFAGKIAQLELAKRSAEIQATWESEKPIVPVVELDFTTFPPKMRVGSSRSVRPSDYHTDKDERNSWDNIVKTAEKEHSAISRFCIPEGEYQKVGLGLLPKTP